MPTPLSPHSERLRRRRRRAAATRARVDWADQTAHTRHGNDALKKLQTYANKFLDKHHASRSRAMLRRARRDAAMPWPGAVALAPPSPPKGKGRTRRRGRARPRTHRRRRPRTHRRRRKGGTCTRRR